MPGLFQKWGFGAELTFSAGAALGHMARAKAGIEGLRAGFGHLRAAAGGLGSTLTGLGAVLAPLSAGIGLAAYRGSGLAASLEANKLTMRVLLGDVGKAEDLLGRIRENAAATPFQEGDLIEGSKRLLRLTGSNVDRNMELLKTMELMAALSPGKTVVDAVEALLDATSGGGFERLKEFQLSFKAEDFKALGRPGGKAWADGVYEALKTQIQAKVRGEDLVGALSQTFGGRMSTLKDAFDNVLRDIGTDLNDTIGPYLAPLGTWISTRVGPAVRGGFRKVFDTIKAGLVTLSPMIRAFGRAWDSLGPSVQGVIGVVGTALVAAIPALVAVGGVVGALVMGLGGLLPALGAIGSAVGSVLGVIVGGGWISVIVAAVGVVVGGVAAALAGLSALAGAVALQGSGWYTLTDVAGHLWSIMVKGATLAWAAIAGFGAGLASALGPGLERIMGWLAPTFERSALAMRLLFDKLDAGAADGSALRAVFEALGWVVGVFLVGALGVASVAIKGILFLGRVLFPVFGALYETIRRIGVALMGWADGSLSWGSALSLLFLTLEKNVLRMVAAVVDAVLWAISAMMRALAGAVGLIPGVGATLAAGLQAGAAGVDAARAGVGSVIRDKVAGVEAGAAAIEAARAARAAPVVNVEAKAGDTQLNLSLPVVVDGKEIARVEGEQAVRAGERGTGPALPAEQRGRVLRRGLEVTPLHPAEVL